jgi:hypothetical protein
MKTLLTALLAATAIGAVAAPAFAHDPAPAPQQYGRYFGGYQSFDELYQHDLETIQHSLRDGAFTRREARDFIAQLRYVKQRENHYRSRDGLLDEREGQDIQGRLERLHEAMHDAHEDGHADQDERGNYGRDANGYYPPSR